MPVIGLSPQPHPGVRRVRPARARAAGRRLRRDPANSRSKRGIQLGGLGLRPLHRLRSHRALRAAHGLRVNRCFINSMLRSPKMNFYKRKVRGRNEEYENTP